MTKYYEIDERLAKLSKQSYSFNDYVDGSATLEYKLQVDSAYELMNEVLKENKEKALYYADIYAKKLANNINKRFSIDISCPSVMIVGAGNYPMKKHEKQMQRLDNSFKEYEDIKEYLNKIKNLKYSQVKTEKQGIAKDVDFSNEFFKVIQNEEINRVQLLFDSKPSDEERTILKKNGFKWSPKNSVWQRQLTNNALYSIKLVINKFAEI